MSGEEIDAETVAHVAELARIDLDESEYEAFEAEFAEILEWFGALDAVPAYEGEADFENVLRPDDVEEGLSQAEALRNAAAREDGYFTGPPVG